MKIVSFKRSHNMLQKLNASPKKLRLEIQNPVSRLPAVSVEQFRVDMFEKWMQS